MIEELFKEKKIKLTKQRKKVYEIIKENNDYVNIKYIINKCKDIDQVTIYRIIELFLEKDIIVKKLDTLKEVYYEIKPRGHIHYINCIKCHKKTKINSVDIENFENMINKDNSFEIISHEIDFQGICKDCQLKK